MESSEGTYLKLWVLLVLGILFVTNPTASNWLLTNYKELLLPAVLSVVVWLRSLTLKSCNAVKVMLTIPDTIKRKVRSTNKRALSTLPENVAVELGQLVDKLIDCAYINPSSGIIRDLMTFLRSLTGKYLGVT